MKNNPTPQHSSTINALHRASNQIHLKKYFEKVIKLHLSDEDYPVDFDDVWPMVYIHKSSAVKDLKQNFIQDIDYQMRKGKVLTVKHSTSIKHKYFLKVVAMEWFVIRKVPSIFDVYREVFHTGKPPAFLNL